MSTPRVADSGNSIRGAFLVGWKTERLESRSNVGIFYPFCLVGQFLIVKVQTSSISLASSLEGWIGCISIATYSSMGSVTSRHIDPCLADRTR